MSTAYELEDYLLGIGLHSWIKTEVPRPEVFISSVQRCAPNAYKQCLAHDGPLINICLIKEFTEKKKCNEDFKIIACSKMLTHWD